MTQKIQPGYPLPSGELGEDDIVCQLVFLPDRPEYWQAFLGAYHYMTTWRAWERDEDKRGKDAAANWREAFEMTMECWRMACLEQLQQDVSDILKALEAGICCPDTDPTEGDQFTDEVEDGVGDVPQNIIDSGYADDAADWDGFADYKCMVAHIVVDSMEAKFLKLAPHVDSAAAVAGGIASVAIIITAIWTGGLSLLLAGLISSLGGVALFYDAMISGSALITLAAKISTNHDALACAFYGGDGSQDSVDDLKDEIDELFTVAEALLLKNSGLEIDSKALYAGRYDTVDTAEILEGLGYDVGDFDCSCMVTSDVSADFDSGLPDWMTSNAGYYATGGNPDGHMYMLKEKRINMTAADMMTEAGYTPEAGDVIFIDRIVCDYRNYDAYANFRIAVHHYDGSHHEHTIWIQEAQVWPTWTEYDSGELVTPVRELSITNGEYLFFENNGTGNTSTLDNLYIWFTVVKA